MKIRLKKKNTFFFDNAWFALNINVNSQRNSSWCSKNSSHFMKFPLHHLKVQYMCTHYRATVFQRNKSNNQSKLIFNHYSGNQGKTRKCKTIHIFRKKRKTTVTKKLQYYLSGRYETERLFYDKRQAKLQKKYGLQTPQTGSLHTQQLC
jgi:hypothetical protein